MQHKSESRDNFSEFAARTEQLALKLGIRVTDLPSELGISEDMLMGYRRGRYPISPKAWGKLHAAENRLRLSADPNGDALHEPQLHYGPRPSVQLNPAYASPPPPPTREQVEAKLRAFLDAAELVPGGMGHAYALACIHFNPATLKALEPSEE